jgi:7-carboxy-7-deazaguanine synthase
MTLPVNEIFETIQGEAAWTGTPAVFLRLQGCDVGCWWCDTKHTWAVDPRLAVSVDAMMAKEGDAPSFAPMTTAEIVDRCRQFQSRHVVITGGEPCRHDLVAITRALADDGRMVQIETSGTQPVRVDDRAWVTVSPKIGMPGGFTVRQDAMRRADEIKYPVGKPADVDELRSLLANGWHHPATDIWLQPLSQSQKATELCQSAARHYGFRVSIQVHKFLGVR